MIGSAERFMYETFASALKQQTLETIRGYGDFLLIPALLISLDFNLLRLFKKSPVLWVGGSVYVCMCVCKFTAWEKKLKEKKARGTSLFKLKERSFI